VLEYLRSYCKGKPPSRGGLGHHRKHSVGGKLSLFRAEGETTRRIDSPSVLVLGMVRIFNVFLDCFRTYVPRCADKIATSPQGRQLKQVGKLLSQVMARTPLESFDNQVRRVCRLNANKQVYVVRSHFQRQNIPLLFYSQL